jgi:hypothetical protein
MAKKCDHPLCDKIADTTAKRYNGEIVQVCEEHRDSLIACAKNILEDEDASDEEKAAAIHWLVLNGIPS